MNSPAVLEITDHCNGEASYSTHFFTDGEYVQQSLSWVLTNTISSVD